jgi:hypothetical protein
MNLYQFETDQLGISETGFHLLRNRFNYETIDFNAISQISLEKGRQIKNWLPTLFVGALLFAFGLFTAIKVVYEFFFADNFHHFYIEQFALPVIPLFLGAYSIYVSLKTGYVLKITSHDDNVRVIPIEELNKKSEIAALELFLKGKLGSYRLGAMEK